MSYVLCVTHYIGTILLHVKCISYMLRRNIAVYSNIKAAQTVPSMLAYEKLKDHYGMQMYVGRQGTT